MQELKVKKSAEMVKVLFNHPKRNQKITLEQYEEARRDYIKDEFTSISQPYKPMPYEEDKISARILIKYGQPYIFLKGQLYEMSKEEASVYTEQYTESVVRDKPRVIQKADVPRYLERHYLAEIFVEPTPENIKVA